MPGRPRMHRWAIAALSMMVMQALVCSSSALAAVDDDCLAGKNSFICHTGRLVDAQIVDGIAAPAMAKAGWAQGCYTVQYVKGDAGGPDTLLLAVHAGPGGKAPACRLPPAEKLTTAEVKRIQAAGGGFDEVLKATAMKSAAKGEAQAASPAQLRQLGQALKSAIKAAPPQTRDQLLRHTRRIALGNGYGGEAEVALP